MFGQSPMKKIDKTIEKASKLINARRYPDAYQLLLKLNSSCGVYIKNYRYDEIDFMFKVCLFEIYHNIEDPRVKKAKESEPKTQEELATHYYIKGSKYESLHDIPKAMEYYKKSANLGCKESMFQVGYLYLESKEIVNDEEAGFYWVKKAAENGYDGAYGTLALLYLKGKGVEKDLDPAKEWMEKAAEIGDIHHVTQLADYFFIHEVYIPAFYWYKKAADNGDAESMYNCAESLLNDESNSPDKIHLIYKYTRDAARKGYQEAIDIMPAREEIFMSYLNVLSDEKLYYRAVHFAYVGDFETALAAYNICAKRGDKRALFNAGKIYLSDDKNLRDYKKGIEIMKKLAEENYEKAQEWLNKSSDSPSE